MVAMLSGQVIFCRANKCFKWSSYLIKEEVDVTGHGKNEKFMQHIEL